MPTSWYIKSNNAKECTAVGALSRCLIQVDPFFIFPFCLPKSYSFLKGQPKWQLFNEAFPALILHSWFIKQIYDALKFSPLYLEAG